MLSQLEKLELIQGATTAYPGLCVNDALYLHLTQLYGAGRGLPDLLAIYGTQDDSFIDNDGRLIGVGVLIDNSELHNGN